MNHIILIGFMGAGKTSVGKELSKALHAAFLDTDEWIERQQGKTINEIFDAYGESYFRDLETETLRQLQNMRKRCVIAVGGGLPVRPENRRILKELGTVFYLKARPETLTERLGGDATRPKLRGGDLRQKIDELMEARGEIYEDAAAREVETDGKTPEEIVKEIADDVL